MASTSPYYPEASFLGAFSIRSSSHLAEQQSTAPSVYQDRLMSPLRPASGVALPCVRSAIDG